MLLAFAIAFLLKRYGTYAGPLFTPVPTFSVSDVPMLAPDDPSDKLPGRSIWDILWSCLATTFACTWVSVHPNAPLVNEGKCTLLRRRLFLMFFSILAPEFMIMWAFKQWRGARMIRDSINEALVTHDMRSVKPWSTTHGHFLQMGGFRLHASFFENHWQFYTALNDPYRSFQYSHDPRPRYRQRIHNLIPWQFANRLNDANDTIWDNACARMVKVLKSVREEEMKVIYVDEVPLVNFDTHIWKGVLTFSTLKRALNEGLMRFPLIGKDEIDDKSKGDAVSKGIALVQLTWFIVQIIVRATQGLAITELELTTAALAGLNSVMYFFWWSKPRDVQCPVVILTYEAEKILTETQEDTHLEWDIPDADYDFQGQLWRSLTSSIKGVFTAITSFPALMWAKISPVPRALAHWSHGAEENCSYGAKICAILKAPYRYLILLLDTVIFDPILQIFEENDSLYSWDPRTSMRGDLMLYSEDANPKPLLGSSVIAGALFGAFHCVAWNFSFPSRVEKIMWRAASFGVVAACFLSLVGACFWFGILKKGSNSTETLLQRLFPVCLAYTIARIFLLVIAVISLRSLPSSAFETVDWVEFIPHI